MMKKFFLAIPVMLFSLASQAGVIDFNSAAGSPDGYVDQGVTFSYHGSGGSSFFSNSPNGTNAITMSGAKDGYMRADISGGTSFVSVDLGDFNSDPDRIFLSIFDSSNNLLASVTQDLTSSFVGMVTLSLASANVAYATFGTTGELGLGGIYADNFTFRPSAVPVPAAVWLMGSGLVGLLGFSRRKTQV